MESSQQPPEMSIAISVWQWWKPRLVMVSVTWIDRWQSQDWNPGLCCAVSKSSWICPCVLCMTHDEGLCLSRPRVSICLMKGSLTQLLGDWVTWSLCARLSDISKGGGASGKFQERNDSTSCDFLSHPAQDQQQPASPEGSLDRGPQSP